MGIEIGVHNLTLVPSEVATAKQTGSVRGSFNSGYSSQDDIDAVFER